MLNQNDKPIREIYQLSDARSRMQTGEYPPFESYALLYSAWAMAAHIATYHLLPCINDFQIHFSLLNQGETRLEVSEGLIRMFLDVEALHYPKTDGISFDIYAVDGSDEAEDKMVVGLQNFVHTAAGILLKCSRENVICTLEERRRARDLVRSRMESGRANRRVYYDFVCRKTP